LKATPTLAVAVAVGTEIAIWLPALWLGATLLVGDNVPQPAVTTAKAKHRLKISSLENRFGSTYFGSTHEGQAFLDCVTAQDIYHLGTELGDHSFES